MDSSPSKNTSSKGKVLFDKSKTAGGGDQEDIWDDRALIRAYERSIKQVKDKLSSGATTTTATTSAPYRGDEEISDDEEEEDEEDEDEYDDEEEENLEYKASDLKKKANPKDWQVGDLCMAIYSEDGLAYPANILNIGEDNKCTVRYLHYLNEEEKSLDELYENVEEVVEEDYKINELTKNITNKETNIRPPMGFLPPPPPIPLPSLDSKVSEDDALHSMLISWYMSGYHTGFYYGLKNAAQNSNKK